MIITLRILGWTLRVSALICITWIFAGVLGGRITDVPQLLSSIAYHAAFATGGVVALHQAKKLAEARTGEPAGA